MRSHSAFLIDLLAESSPEMGVEVGVFEGDNSSALLENLPSLETLVCVDSFCHYEEFDQATPRKNGKVFNANYSEVKQKFLSAMAPFSGRYTVIEEFSDGASRMFKDDAFDFVFIDANHAYEYVLTDIILWIPKVKSGGIIAGHDYVTKPGYGVIQAVKEMFPDSYSVNYKAKCWYATKA